MSERTELKSEVIDVKFVLRLKILLIIFFYSFCLMMSYLYLCV